MFGPSADGEVMRIRVKPKLLRYSRLAHIWLSIVMLLVLVFFSITGIFLNHPDWFEAEPQETITRAVFAGSPLELESEELPAELTAFIRQELGVEPADGEIEVDIDLLFVEIKQPGVSTSVEIDLITGEAEAITTQRGLIATLNELHKGRNAQMLWIWLLDVSAVLVVLFSISGLILLIPNRRIAAITVGSVVGLGLILVVAL